MAVSPLVYIGLSNPKSPTNVGSVMRAVGCYRANQVRYTGERFDRAAKYHTDTKNALGDVPLAHVNDLLIDLTSAMNVVCVELVEGATALPVFEHPAQAIYIFGPEDGSIDQQLVDQADHVVYVPTQGCMNLAASVNVLLYDRLAKGKIEVDDASMVRRNRDINNRLKIKSADQKRVP